MRRLSALVATALVATVSLLVVTQAGVAKGGKVVASASGSGHIRYPGGEFRNFSFTARQYSDGTDAGQAQLRNRLLQNTPIHVEITCLSVVGNEAHMTGFVKSIGTETPPFFVKNSSVAFTVRDNGPGNADQLSLMFFYGPVALPSCNVFFPVVTDTATNGNVTVR